mgnify:CR=1 FL=1
MLEPINQYGSRLELTREFVNDVEYEDVKKAVLLQVEKVLDHAFVKDGAPLGSDMIIKFYFNELTLSHTVDVKIRIPLEENDEQSERF